MSDDFKILKNIPAPVTQTMWAERAAAMAINDCVDVKKGQVSSLMRHIKKDGFEGTSSTVADDNAPIIAPGYSRVWKQTKTKAAKA